MSVSWLDRGIAVLYGSRFISNKQRDEALSELHTLRAEAEAWRAVRERSDARESHYKVHHEVLRQIARLDAMKEGKSNGNS